MCVCGASSGISSKLSNDFGRFKRGRQRHFPKQTLSPLCAHLAQVAHVSFQERQHTHSKHKQKGGEVEVQREGPVSPMMMYLKR